MMFFKRLTIFSLFVCMMGIIPSLYAQSNSNQLLPQLTATVTAAVTLIPTQSYQPTATPAITATVVPTATPEITATVVPTATPAITATVVPTATPEITATVVPTATRDLTATVTVTPIMTPVVPTCDSALPISADAIQYSRSFTGGQTEQWFQISTMPDTDYRVEGYVLPQSQLDLSIEMYQDCSQPLYDSQNYTFTSDIRLSYYAEDAGTLFIRVKNNTTYGGQYYLSIRPLIWDFNPGAGIVVAGRGALDQWQNQTNQLAVEFYQYLTSHAYRDQDIYLMSTNFDLDPTGDTVSDVDVISYSGNLNFAVTFWAKSRVSANKPLVIYIASDDGSSALSLNGGDNVSAEQLNQWLGELETAVPNVPIVIIIESSQSGTFAKALATAPNRMVISSSNDTLSWGTAEGAFFSDHLLSALQEDMSLVAAFRKAQWATQIAHPNQKPQLYADGNQISNQFSDYERLSQQEFSFTGTFSEALWPPMIQSADIDPATGELVAKVTDEYRPDQLSVWAVLQPLTETISTSTHLYSETLPTVQLLLQPDGSYIGTVEGYSAELNKVIVYAKHPDELIAQPYNAEEALFFGFPTAVSSNTIQAMGVTKIMAIFLSLMVGLIFLWLTLWNRQKLLHD